MVRAAQRGDRRAFDALVQSYEELAFRAAYLIVREEADAADVAQDAFVRAYRSLNTFDSDRPFRPWLLRIVTNVALNNTRSTTRRDAATDRLARTQTARRDDTPETAVESTEQSERVWQAIANLPRDDQRLIYLRYFLEASEAEAAEAIGKPLGTVKSRTHRALKRLRGVIEHKYPDLLPHAPRLLKEEQA